MQNVKVDRYKYIGGSDIPVIMGISPFKTRWQLLREKAQLEEDTFEGNKYTEFGNVIEEQIRDFVNSMEEDKFVEGKHIFEEEHIRIHTDGENTSEIIEIKSTSQIHNELIEYKIYLVQLLFYLVKEKKEKGRLYVYDRPEDFNTKFNPFNLQRFNVYVKDFKELIEEIKEALELFENDLERLKANPNLTENDFIYVPEEVKKYGKQLEALEDKILELKEIEEEANTIKEKIKQAMVKSNIKKWITPKGLEITNVADSEDKEVEKFNEKKFAKENEKLYKKYLEKTIQKGKKGGLRISRKEENK